VTAEIMLLLQKIKEFICNCPITMVSQCTMFLCLHSSPTRYMVTCVRFSVFVFLFVKVEAVRKDETSSEQSCQVSTIKIYKRGKREALDRVGL
jgi:hypothetical protein